MSATQNLRYPGVRPFERNERHLFFGRARDIADLYDLVLLEKLLVLFGKSGYGKSSLLKAGILPLFTDFAADDHARYKPVEVRFGSHIEGRSFSPFETTINTLTKELQPYNEADFLKGYFNDKSSLWWEIKRRQNKEQYRFLLIFDQFEEFFTYPVDMQDAFAARLAEALYEITPQAIRAVASDNFTPEQRDFLATAFDLKVVFSIRADRLSLLDSLKTKLPAILNKRYELKALDEKQARSAIVRPALLSPEEGNFTTPAFSFQPVALDQIIEELSDEKSGRIEAFQLQVVCQYLEKQVHKGLIADRDDDQQPDIYPEDLPNFETVFEDYYKDKLEELTPTDATAARILIEDGLLFVNDATGEARRLSKDPGELVQTYQRQGVTQTLLQKLESTYLLRREANSVGGYNYEISHDTLIAPITKSRELRRREEERYKTLRKARQAFLVVLFSVLTMIGAVILALWAMKQRDIAEESLKQIKAERAVRERLEFKSKRQDAANFMAVNYCELTIRTLADMDSIVARHPELQPELDSFKVEVNRSCKSSNFQQK